VLGAGSSSELDDLFAPFKPPAKGTLADRAKQVGDCLLSMDRRMSGL
jgi:hypothetical protein